jgi:hypothetical protein
MFKSTEKMTSNRLFDILRNYYDRFQDQLSKLHPQLRLDAFFVLVQKAEAAATAAAVCVPGLSPFPHMSV